MSRREELNLHFRKIQTARGFNFSCESGVTTGPSLDYAIILSGYDIAYTQHLINNIVAAQNNEPFEVSHLTDNLLDDFEVRIVPPNVEVTDSNYVIPMQVWKELMQEWLAFLQS